MVSPIIDGGTIRMGVRKGHFMKSAALAVKKFLAPGLLILSALVIATWGFSQNPTHPQRKPMPRSGGKPLVTRDPVIINGANMIIEGRNTFRFDTYGDQAFWGDTLRLHQAIEGSQFGGVGPGLTPRTALAVGLKVDANALPKSVIADIQ